MTPAMAAGVTGKLWSVGDIVDLIECDEAMENVVKSHPWPPPFTLQHLDRHYFLSAGCCCL
jgi:hypothetical protein